MKEDLYINLIYKKLSGEISDQETKDLDVWLEKAKENRETLDGITAAWEVSGDLNPSVSIDLDQEFAALDRRIEEDDNLEEAPAKVKPLKPTEKKSSFSTLWRIAAGIVFLIGGYFIAQNVLGSKSQLVEVITTDKIKQVDLPDGTHITLNKNSSIAYDKNFSDQVRLVALKGEAFFNVQHDTERPFLVNFNKQQVEVVGTSFNIKTNAEQSTVALVSGEVFWIDKASKKALKLLPSMTVTKNLISGVVDLTKDAGFNFDFWQDQKIQFDETPLKNVLLDLKRIFNVEFTAIPENLNNCQFSSNFEKATLESILETISTVFTIEVITLSANKYQLKGGECQ